MFFPVCSHPLEHTCKGKTKHLSPLRWINTISVSKMWRIGHRSTSHSEVKGDYFGVAEVQMLKCPALAPQAGIIRQLQEQISFAQNYRIWWELARQHMILKTHSAGKEPTPAGTCSRFPKGFVLIFNSLKTTDSSLTYTSRTVSNTWSRGLGNKPRIRCTILLIH